MSFEKEDKIILFTRQKGEPFKLYYDKGYLILNSNPSTEEEYNALVIKANLEINRKYLKCEYKFNNKFSTKVFSNKS